MINIDEQLLNQLSEEAQQNTRKRCNYNFHTSSTDRIQRLLNAMEPGTYIQPHRHINPAKREVFMVLRGTLVVIIFNDQGKIITSTRLNISEGCYGVEVAPGEWHTIIAMEKGSVAYEFKDGPYNIADDKNFAPWAPTENTKEVSSYLNRLTEEIIKPR